MPLSSLSGAASNLQGSLARSRTAITYAPSSLDLLLLCRFVSSHSFPTRTLLIGFRAHPDPVWPHLIELHQQSARF